MNRFEYASPSTVESAVQLLSGGAAVLAGGTDLLSLMKDGAASPSRLVSIKNIPDLRGIAADGSGGLRIGALATVEEVLSSPLIREEYPSLRQAADGIRSPQIQSVGTVGGDLCQRPRCWYYRSGFGLLAQKDGRSLVVEGDNRFHAILGADGPAYFVNPSSFAPPLIALGARLRIQGTGAAREVAVADFYRIPASEGQREYDLAENELVTEILIPAAAGKRNAVYEVREKEALDWPLAAAAVALEMDGDTVRSARVVLGHVAPRPWVAEAAAQALAGNSIGPETAEAAGAAAVEGAKPLSRNGYKVRLARVAVKRAILRAAGMEVA
jgi:xanthine dehydrogenase YagS FAD-binding subunit